MCYKVSCRQTPPTCSCCFLHRAPPTRSCTARQGRYGHGYLYSSKQVFNMPESWLFILDLKLAEGLKSGSSAVSLLMSHDTWRLAGLEPILDSWLPLSEVWLVTVERRVDMKLLLAERRSRGGTRSRMPRNGMYFANAILHGERRQHIGPQSQQGPLIEGLFFTERPKFP
ncbi:hypothetical protein EYF80_044310 [Liparis tanakae]|uniref:Uncharacterized protein n=1 Tax=Liparis tanakae TaxID=230148 RepID=A0A4Z2FXM9_9TELE|nr:hypothetical protein EYF80_044310 [Liparis tanakae]